MSSEENPQPLTGAPVGQQLQQAREKLGLTVAQVANTQHLRVVIIQAIEAGDYAQIDSELFLKGYVRAYAKQVGLDGDAVIADLDQELQPLRQQREQELEANPLVDIERRRRQKRRIAKALLFVAVIVLAAYLVFTFVLPQPQSEQAGPETPEPASVEAPETSAAETASGDPVVADGGVNDSADNPGAGGAGENDSVSEPADGNEATPETGPAETEAPVLADTSGAEATDDSVADRIPVVEESTEPALADPPGIDDVVVAQLDMSFTADCWVQVSDADGNRLVSALQRAGDQLSVSGEAPLRVVVGAVDAVSTIRFQGEPVDMGNYRVVNNRSEFTLTI